MKKILLISSLLILLVSCENTTYVERATDLSRKIIDIEIRSGDWKYTNNSKDNFYYAVVSIPEITKDVYDNGIVAMYVEYLYTDGTRALSPLPNVIHKEYNDNGVWQTYTQTINYEYSVGEVVITLTYSDFVKGQPGDYHFLLKMLW